MHGTLFNQHQQQRASPWPQQQQAVHQQQHPYNVPVVKVRQVTATAVSSSTLPSPPGAPSPQAPTPQTNIFQLSETSGPEAQNTSLCTALQGNYDLSTSAMERMNEAVNTACEDMVVTPVASPFPIKASTPLSTSQVSNNSSEKEDNNNNSSEKTDENDKKSEENKE